MKSLVIRAPLLTQSGYGTHSRQIFKWAKNSKMFSKVSLQPVPWGITSWLISQSAENGLVGEIMEKATGDGNFDVSIQVQLPNEWDVNLARFNVGITAAVETDKCNPSWIDACNRMNAVIVPSSHTKNTLEKSGNLKVPVLVVPESYFEEIDEEVEENLDLNTSTNFNFLAVGQVTGHDPGSDRKNIFNLIKWFCEEFSEDSDVGLILKTNSGRSTKIDKNITRQLVEKILNEVRKGPYPKVHLLHGSFTQKEMAALYKHPSVKSLVTTTRGEGFGLPLLEAAASDLPVIATNWSAHLDFLNKGKFIPLNYNLAPIYSGRVDNNIFMEGTRWAEVDEKDFKRKIRKFRKSPEIPKRWAEDLGEKIRNSYSQKAINNEYEKVFCEILK